MSKLEDLLALELERCAKLLRDGSLQYGSGNISVDAEYTQPLGDMTTQIVVSVSITSDLVLRRK